MDEVATAMGNLAGMEDNGFNSGDIHAIVQRRGEFQNRLRESFYRIIDLWPEILSNEARRFEVARFISRYRSFRLSVRTAADIPELPPPLDEAIPRYGLFLDELDIDMSVILKEFSSSFPASPRPDLRGIARSLRFYVQEADDEFYERLIVDRVYPSRPLRWRGPKVAATLFARHFCLTDSEMNRTFVFPSHGRTYRGLKLSSNVTTKGDDRHGIAAILSRYPYPG